MSGRTEAVTPQYDERFWLRAVRQYFEARMARANLALLLVDGALTLLEARHGR